MSTCKRCGKVYREPEGEAGEHPCPKCGYEWWEEGKCRDCHGAGSVECRSCAGENLDTEPCYECNSTGKIECETCGGTGEVDDE